MNKLAIGMLAALAAGLGQAAVTVGPDETVTAAAEDYVLQGGTLVFGTAGQAYAGSISGYGSLVNATGVPVDMSGATLTADGGTLALKGTRTIKAQWIRFTSLATRPNAAGSGGGPQLDEIEILKNGVVIPYDMAVCAVTCVCGNKDYSTSATPVFNNNNIDKAFIQVDYGTVPVPVVFTVNLGAETEFDAYRFYVGNDCPGRDPISFTFEVSSDGQNWTQLHSATNYRPTPKDACLRCSPTENFSLVPRTAFCSGKPTVTVAADAELDLVDTDLEIASGSVAGTLRFVDGRASVSGAVKFSGTAFGDGELTLDGVEASGTLGTPLTRTCRFVRFTVTRDRGNGVANYNLEGWAMSRLNLTLGGERVAYPAGSTVTLLSRDADRNSEKKAEAQSLLTDDNTATYFNLEVATPIVIEMPEPVTFDGYNWWSRGDMPCRDPRSWIFEVSEDGKKWVALDAVIDCPYQELAYNGTELRNAQIYGTTFTEPGFTVRYLNGATFSGDYANAGRIVREDGKEIGFAASEGGIRFAPTGDFEFKAESELPGKNLDLTGGNLVYTGLVPLTLTGYDISAVRGESRIDLGHAATFAESSFNVSPEATLAFNGATDYMARYVRFASLAVRPSGGNANQGPAIGELELLLGGTVIPYNGATVTVTVPDKPHTPNEPAKIVDNNTGTKDFENVGSGTTKVVFTIDLGRLTAFDAYRWWSADQDGRDPYTWTFEISRDGENWVEVDRQTAYRKDEALPRSVASDTFSIVPTGTAFGADANCAVIVDEGGELAIFNAAAVLSDAEIDGTLRAVNANVTVEGGAFTGIVAGNGTVAFSNAQMNGTSAQGVVQRCRYYRFTSLRTRPAGMYQNQGPQMSEIELLRNGEVVPYDTAKVSVSASPVVAGANLPALCNNNHSGDKCYYGVNSGTRPVLFTVDLGQETEFDGYDWWSGNDGTGRDPYNWRFEVSNDGVNWVMLDEVLGEDTIHAVIDNNDNTSYRNSKMYEKTFSKVAQDLFSDAATLTLGPDAAVALDNVVERIGNLAGSGTVTLANDAVLELTPSADNRDIFTGSILGSGTVKVIGGKFRYRKMTVGEGVKFVYEEGGRGVEMANGLMILIR